MTLTAGLRLGPYEIVAPLGAGGMGEVYRARDTRLGRDVAVKVLPESFARDAERLRRFAQEAKAASTLSHPNILVLHDVGEEAGTAYLVTELLEGETLRERLRAGPLPQRRAVEIAIQIAHGLAAAHEKGIVHRDVKPENLFLTRSGLVKILDFGLARAQQRPRSAAGQDDATTVADLSEPGSVVGTAGYMSPEQVRGQPLDSRSDLFSLGIVLYEMLTGRRAFHGESAVETMNAILHDEPETPEAGARLPPVLDRVVRHCLEKDREERFQSARDLAFGLQSLSNVSASERAAIAKPTRRRILREAGLVSAGAALASVGFLSRGWLGGARILDHVRTRRLTYRRGQFPRARFTWDGQTVVYSAQFDGNPPGIFSARLDSAGELALGHANALAEAVSSKGELALLVDLTLSTQPSRAEWLGKLARAPLVGGAPRGLVESVVAADWAPNGEDLAFVREVETTRRLEYPMGRTLRTADNMHGVRVSPTGDVVAVDDVADGNFGFSIQIVDGKGKARPLTQGWSAPSFAWSPTGKEIVLAGYRNAGEAGLHAVELSGRVRLLLPTLGDVRLLDVSQKGSVLLGRRAQRPVVMFRAGSGAERDLSWGTTDLTDLSADGRFIALGNGEETSVRGTDGSPAVRLGESPLPPSLSPDGKWLLAMKRSERSNRLVIHPTGVGAPREVHIEGADPAGAAFLPDGRIILAMNGPGAQSFLRVAPFEGGRAIAVPTPGWGGSNGLCFSRDGRICYATAERKLRVAPIDGGADVRDVPGPRLEPPDGLVNFSEDGRFVFAAQRALASAKIFRIELETGERKLWKELRPADPGVNGISSVFLAGDGETYAYSYVRIEADDLYVVEGLLGGTR